MIAFQKAVTFFAHNLREIKPADEFTLLRESYMNTTIQKLIKQGIHEDDIVVVCGAFHIEGIMEAKVLPDAQYEKLQKDISNITRDALFLLSIIIPYHGIWCR